MGHFSEDILARAGGLFARAAAEQGGVISGDNPSRYNAADPLRLWVIQVVIIILFTQLLSLGLSRIRQPRVIAEVIGGVILGPSIMGRIPHFSNRIFPSASIPLLTLTATIGLVFFLFIVGLEIDTRVLRSNARASLTISAAGLILPFGLGAALAIPLYNQFIEDTVNKGFFILFVAVAVGITAFPVLCRILTELKLLDTTVGVVVLAAGVGNDVVGWILLALTVALVNASSGLTALWVLLAATAYVIFLLYPVRMAFLWLARKTGSLENGPTTLMMTVTFLLVLGSAFFTDIIGIHAIFGGFLAGLVIPHEGGFAIALVEKMEDLISIVFLPIYFTLSGLNTNLGTLNNGITWGYTVLICVVAFAGKFIGSFVSAKLSGFSNRESGAIGTLMSCKGLVELIVLNIGLQAGILNTRTFSMFVVCALVLTFITTPLTLLWYPQRVRTTNRAISARRPVEGAPPRSDASDEAPRTNFTVILNKVEHLPAIMTLTQLLQGHISPLRSQSSVALASGGSETHGTEKKGDGTRLSIHALRLIELSDRTSAVLKSQDASALVRRDSVVSVFRTFGHLNRIPVDASLAVVTHDEFAATVAGHAQDTGAQMVIVPWTAAAGTPHATLEDSSAGAAAGAPGPFEGVFGKGDKATSVQYSHFVRRVFAEAPADVALFVDRGPAAGGVDGGGCSHRLFLPFFGGPDDRLALSFVVQLCANPAISAAVVRVTRTDEQDPTDEDAKLPVGDAAGNLPTIQSISGFPDTVYGHGNTQTHLVSDMADNLVWGRFTRPSAAHAPAVEDALRRITFTEVRAAQPLHRVLELARTEAVRAAASWEAQLIVVGRGRRLAADSHHAELKKLMGAHGAVPSEIRKAVGDVGAAFVAAGAPAGMLVLQAALTPASAFV